MATRGKRATIQALLRALAPTKRGFSRAAARDEREYLDYKTMFCNQNNKKRLANIGKTESSQLGQSNPYPYPIIDLAGLSVPR